MAHAHVQQKFFVRYSFVITWTFIGMSEKREYAIAAYLPLCRIFLIFEQSAHIAYFSAYFGIFGGNELCSYLIYG